ncbi:hypothetical protein PENSPDRAFT_343788 [Peniophora sp. CONT]|nr:hypothetical protein PENSPDRAFT_343788 [Peniophora sp. CONT]
MTCASPSACCMMASPTPPSEHSPTLSTVLAWYAAAASWDFDALANLFDDTYHHKTIPAIADDGIKDKEKALAYARSISEALGKLPMKYEIFDHIESDNRVWAHSRLYAEEDGKTLFNNESIFLFTLTEGDKPKVKEIREFVDTKTLSDWKSQSL